MTRRSSSPERDVFKLFVKDVPEAPYGSFASRTVPDT